MERELSRTLLAIRRRHPFFAALSMFAEYRFEKMGATPVATDGRRIHVDSEAFASWGHEDRCYMLLHVLLHAALLHTSRRGVREAGLWNLAADIVVDNAIEETESFKPSFETFADERFKNLNAEQIYAHLRNEGGDCNTGRKSDSQRLGDPKRRDLLDPFGPESSVDEFGGSLLIRQKPEAELRQYWKQALQRARAAERLRCQRTGMQGSIPDWLDREIDTLSTAELDWRTMLWRFVVRTPCDYVGFDRRFLWQGLYLDALDGEALRVHVAVDTSGSIGEEQLTAFLSEIDAMVRSYPHIECWLSCIDAALHGPHKVEGDILAMPVKGGGGTDFRPFFEMIEQDNDPSQTICVFLTDGFGNFPRKAPDLPVLWVLTTDGLDAEEFPFGEVVRLTDSDGLQREAGLL